MANSDAPFGFAPFDTTDGSDYHAKMREVEFLVGDSTACAVGDFVRLTGTTGADGLTPVVTRAAAGATLLGAIVSFEPDFEGEAFINAGPLRLASTSRKAKVCWGSQILYKAQASTALVAADAGQNADILVGTADTITGVSGGEIGVVIAAGATGQVRIHRLDGQVGNELAIHGIWVVSINEPQEVNGTGV